MPSSECSNQDHIRLAFQEAKYMIDIQKQEWNILTLGLLRRQSELEKTLETNVNKVFTKEVYENHWRDDLKEKLTQETELTKSTLSNIETTRSIGMDS